jgi:hypothetical protein
VEIDNVKQVDSARQQDGTYLTTVKDKNNNTYYFVTNNKGKVTKYVKVQQ